MSAVVCEEFTTSTPVIVRHVVLRVGMRPHPYVRMTQHGMRRPDAKAYIQWRDRVRNTIRAGLTVGPYSPSDWLGVAVSAAAKRAAPVTAPRRKDGEIDQRRVSGILDFDGDNVLKAICDALNGIIWPDDKRVRLFGPSDFYDESGDGFTVHIWGGPECPEWREEWKRPDWRME